MFGALVAGRAWAEGAEYRLAINVDVKDVRLNVRDLTEIVATKAGEYARVTVIPDNRIQEAISEERASINQKCKAGQLDQKCQISLGGDLGATYWLQVSVVRGGKACTVRISCLSIAHGVQEASALESAPCDSDSVTKAIGGGLSKVSAKLGWGGAEAAPAAASAPAPAPAPAAASDPLAAEKARLADAKREKAEAAARQKQHLADASRDYAEVEKNAKDVGAPVEARLLLVARFLEAYADAPERARALKLKERLEAEAQKARAAADQKAAASVPADMVFVPAGKFWFGCNEKVDQECDDNERPGKILELPAFLIDKTEVRVADYARCVEAGRCSDDGLSMPWYEGKAQPDAARYCNWGRPGREQHPINCLDSGQATAFCAFMNKRMPTEQEWEKAARGTDRRKYAWGNAPAPGGKVANVAGAGGKFDGTSPAGAFPAGASPFGALDMIGNVAEWCTSEQMPGNRALRGGSWFLTPRFARASARGWELLMVRHISIGLRCAQSVP